MGTEPLPATEGGSRHSSGQARVTLNGKDFTGITKTRTRRGMNNEVSVLCYTSLTTPVLAPNALDSMPIWCSRRTNRLESSVLFLRS